MTRLVPAFWTLAALDTLALAVMLVATLGSQAGHQDGGREMGLFFFVIVPFCVLALAVLLFLFVRAPFARYLALIIVALPALFWVWVQVDDLRIDRAIESNRTGAGYFSGSAMRAMAVAVVDRDLETMRRIGPTVDVNAVGKHDTTLLRLAIDRDPIGVPQPSDVAEVPVVKLLLALGARPDSGLERAVKRPDTTLLRLLLDAGGDPNLRRPGEQALVFSWYPVMTPEALRLLAAHGLDPNVRYYDDPIAVLFTIYQRWDLVDVLIDLGTDIDRPRPDGRNVRGELSEQMAEELAKGHALPDGLLKLAHRLDVQPAAAR